MPKTYFFISILLQLVFFVSLSLEVKAEISCQQRTQLSATKSLNLLEQVQLRYAQIKSIAAVFSQTSYMAALEVTESSSGNVWFSKPGKMRWEYIQPDPQTFLINNATMWFYQPRENQLLIDDVAEVLISDLPVAFLLGIGNLKSQFKIEQACHGKHDFVFKLRPLVSSSADAMASKASQLKSFDLQVNKNFDPTAAKVTDISGNITTIELDEMQFDQDYNADKFLAQFPKGLDVSDRRAVRG